MSRGSYLKDLANLGTLDDDVDFVVCDDTLSSPDDKKGYKVSAADVKSYIGTPTPTPPLTLQDAAGLSSSVGGITTTGDSYATLSSGTDHTNLSVGDMIYIASRPYDSNPYINFVVAKETSPTIRIVTTGSVITPSTSFSYGDPSIILEDYAGNIRGGWGTRGLAVDGSISLDGSVDASDTLASDEVKTDIIGGRNSLVDAQYLFYDGHIETPYQESFCATLTSNQTLSLTTWEKVEFNTTSSTVGSHSLGPSGMTGFDTTNHCFVVPYNASSPYYRPRVYHFDVSLRFHAVISSTTSVNWYLVTGSSPTGSHDNVLANCGHELYVYSGSNTVNQSLNLSGSFLLDPRNDSTQRYVWVEVYAYGGTSVYLDGDTPNNRTYFTGFATGAADPT